MEKDNGTTVIIVGLMLLGIVYTLFTLGNAAVIASCNTKDEHDRYTHRNSWLCATKNGERLTNEQN